MLRQMHRPNLTEGVSLKVMRSTWRELPDSGSKPPIAVFQASRTYVECSRARLLLLVSNSLSEAHAKGSITKEFLRQQQLPNLRYGRISCAGTVSSFKDCYGNRKRESLKDAATEVWRKSSSYQAGNTGIKCGQRNIFPFL